jgi:beta-lactamase superfamily II metal-dependent hydrolase
MRARLTTASVACLRTAAAAWALALLPAALRAQATVGQPLPRWTAGTLDIHQISTGRGNSALVVFPDGTSLLVDAGATGSGVAPESEAHPDSTRSPGEWIARYVSRHLPDSAAGLDYALLTHFHIDHMGHVLAESPPDSTGAYRMTGITEVGTRLRIGTLIDRGWPDYAYPAPLEDGTVANYRAFIRTRQARGLRVERFRSGARDQIRPLREPARFAGVEVRNIVGNGDVWTGVGEQTRPLFPPMALLAPADWPTENMCSLGIRVSYGEFRWFTGGDLPGETDPGFPAWHAVEAGIAQAIGRVDVHVVNHHGSPGVAGDAFLETLGSKVLIIPAWSASHPGPDVLKRIVNNRYPPAQRFVFATDLRPSARTVIGARANSLAAPTGHVITRVEPGGHRYWILVTSNADERDTVLSVHGPFDAGTR